MAIHPHGRPLLVRSLALLVALGAPLPSVLAQDRQEPAGSLPEYVVKAGFLYNFAKYVEWPAGAFARPDEPVSIGIVGADPFGENLESVLKDKRVKNRAFTIHRFPSATDVQRCHMLFISRTETPHLPEILQRIDSWPILTIGEAAGFSRAGGSINILVVDEKPTLEVNPDAAAKAGLTIDAKLLKAATIVRTAR